MAETTNSNSNNALGEGGEHVTNARVLADIQADIKAGPGTGKPKPAPRPARHTIVPTKGGRKR